MKKYLWNFSKIKPWYICIWMIVQKKNFFFLLHLAVCECVFVCLCYNWVQLNQFFFIFLILCYVPNVSGRNIEKKWEKKNRNFNYLNLDGWMCGWNKKRERMSKKKLYNTSYCWLMTKWILKWMNEWMKCSFDRNVWNNFLKISSFLCVLYFFISLLFLPLFHILGRNLLLFHFISTNH